MKFRLSLLLTLGLGLSFLIGCNQPGGTPEDPADPSGGGEPETLSGDVVKYSAVLRAEMVHVRYPFNSPDATVIGNEEKGFGPNWQYDGWELNDITIDSEYSSYARFTVNAPFAGQYPIKLHAKRFNQEFPIRVYVNSKAVTDAKDLLVSDAEYAWGTEEKTTNELQIPLNKGTNVILVQVFYWGAVNAITFPKELTILTEKGKNNDSGIYTSDDMIYQAAFAETGFDVLSNEKMKYQALTPNSNPSYEAAAILHFTPKSSTKSLDVTYKVKTQGNGGTIMAVKMDSDATIAYNINLDDSQLNTEKVVHVPTNALVDLGFTAGSNNNLRLSSVAGAIEIINVKESNIEDASNFKNVGVAELKEKTLIRGRTISNDSYIGLDWTGAGIEFDVTGGGDVVAFMRNTADVFGAIDTSSGGTRFAVEVDGVFKGYVTPSSNMVLATNLSTAKHSIALYKTSEAAGGLVDMLRLKIAKNSSISKPANKQYNFEILGDSITCGNQISATEENGYLAYSTQLAKSYNANFNTISCSGRGLYIGYNSEAGWAAKYNDQINSIWGQTSFFRDGGTSTWNTANFTPDVVIANLGNNDLGEWPVTIMEGVTPFMNEVKSFSQKLRTAYPNAKIIWCYGAFVNRSYESEYRAAVESLNDPNIQFVYFDKMGGGAQDHPNANEHQTIANVLSAKIASMLGVSDPRA